LLVKIEEYEAAIATVADVDLQDPETGQFVLFPTFPHRSCLRVLP